MAQKGALIVVDMQNDFCLSDGCLYVKNSGEIIPVINKIKQLFEICIFTKCWHTADHISFVENHNISFPDENGKIPTINMPWGKEYIWPLHCVQGTEGAKIHKSLNVSGNDLVLHKGINPERESYSAFVENDRKNKPSFDDGRTLEKVLKDNRVNKVYVCGVATDFCVGETALDSVDCGFNTFFVEDASAGSNPKLTKKMKEQMMQKGIKIIFSSELEGV